jgi:hypothetical protein
MNGATEATLAELLQVSKGMAAAITKLANASSSGGGGSSASNLASAFNPLSIAASGVKAAFGLLSDVVSGLVSVIGKLAGGVVNAVSGLIDFAAAAAKGQATLQTLYASFTKLPFYIGELMSVFSKIIGYSEGLLESYRNITKAGASFSGNLFEMARAAAKSYMSMDEFANVVNSNSEFFATMSGNVQRGIDTFVDIQNQMLGPSSRYSKALFGLGYTASEVAEGLLGIMKSGVIMNRSDVANTDRLMNATSVYLTELDTLSKITGKRKDQIAREVEAAENDQIWKTFMENITDPQQQAYIKTALATATVRGGQGMVDAVKGQFMGLDTPITQAAKNLFILSNGLSSDGTAIRKGLEMSKTDLNGANRMITRQLTEVAVGAGQFLTETLDPIALAAGAGAKLVNQQAMESARLFKKNGSNLDAMIAASANQQGQQARGNAAALAKVQQDIKNFGSTILGLASTVIEPVTNKLTEWGNIVVGWTAKTVEKYMPLINQFVKFMDEQIKPKLIAIAGWFGTQFQKLASSKSSTEFFTTLIQSTKEGFSNIWAEIKPVWDKEIKPVLISLWEGLIEAITPLFNKMFDKITDSINAWMFSVVGERFGAVDPAKQEKFRKADAELQTQLTMIKTLMEEKKQKEKENIDVTGTNAAIKAYVNLAFDAIKKMEFAAEVGSKNVEYGNRARESLRNSPANQIRNLGTLGALGRTSEPSDTSAMIHQGERVLNAAETAIYNNLGTTLSQLNNMTSQVLAAMRESNDISRRTLSATRSLSGDLFA